MSDNITQKKLSSLIKIQRKFRFLKNEIDEKNKKLSFYKLVLTSMINNLIYCNNLKIFQNINSSYIAILGELKEIKDMIDAFPDYITMKYINIEGLQCVSLRLIKCELLILKYFNHIAPENLSYIFQLIFNDKWFKFFEKEDLEKFIFISRFFIPICIWVSDIHKSDINLNIKNTEPLNKNTIVTKDLIETLLGIKKPNNYEKNDSIIISNESSNIPEFFKSISDIIDNSPKNVINKRNNHFDNFLLPNLLLIRCFVFYKIY